MRKFIAGVVIGLLLSAGSSRAEWGWGEYGVLKELRDTFNAIHVDLSQTIHADLLGIRMELQRIANAQDRLVTIESSRQPAEARGRAEAEKQERNK